MSCDWKTCPTCGKFIWVYKLSPEQVNEMGGFCVCREYPEFEHVRYPHDKNGRCTVTMAELCGHVGKETIKESVIRMSKENKDLEF